MKNIKIVCKGIADIRVGRYEMTVEVEDVSPSFITHIEEKDIVLYCNDIDKLIEEIDDEYIFEYLRKQGVIYNKG